MTSFVAIYDACVLYPNTLRDILVRIALDGLVQAKWTERILDEAFDSLQKNRPDLDGQHLRRTRNLMTGSVRDCLVKGYEPLEKALTLPDPNDRHVLAAAIKAHAQLIVTFNLPDFPAEQLAQWDVEAKHPDDFLVDQIHLDPQRVYVNVQRIADSWRRPPGTVDDVLASLERSGIVQAAAALRALEP